MKKGTCVLFCFMTQEDISENFSESYNFKNLKFEKFGKSQLKMVSLGLIQVSFEDLWSNEEINTDLNK